MRLETSEARSCVEFCAEIKANQCRELMLYDSSFSSQPIFFPRLRPSPTRNLLFAIVWWILKLWLIIMHSSRDFAVFFALSYRRERLPNSWSVCSRRDVLLIKQWNLCFYHFPSPSIHTHKVESTGVLRFKRESFEECSQGAINFIWSQSRAVSLAACGLSWLFGDFIKTRNWHFNDYSLDMVISYN